MFAKLFEGDTVGQVVVILDTDEESKPQVTFKFQPEGYGVCSIGPSWPDTDEGWDNAESYFAKVDEELAFGVALDTTKKFLEECADD